MIINVEGGTLPQAEIDTYVSQITSKYHGAGIKSITLSIDGDFVNVKTEFADDIPFERVRRITGYLVGTLDRFCNGKRAEEHDRVKHTLDRM